MYNIHRLIEVYTFIRKVECIMSIAETLKTLRIRHGLTQEQVAKVLNLTRSAYAYYEIGTSKPGYESVLRLARLYDVSTDIILSGSDLSSVSGHLKDDGGEFMRRSSDRDKYFGLLSADEQQLILRYRASADKSGIMRLVEEHENLSELEKTRT